MTASSNLAFVDLETLGLDPDRNPVWDVAVIVDDVEHTWTQQIPLTKFRPNHDDRSQFWFPAGVSTPEIADCLWIGDRVAPFPYISEWVIENTGISERYLHDDALTEGESIKRFCDLVAGRHLVGAVPSFDEERMRRIYRKWYTGATQFPWHYHLQDVETLAVGFLRGVDIGSKAIHEWPLTLPWDSEELSEALGVPVDREARHTALGDARWAKAMYEAVMGQ